MKTAYQDPKTETFSVKGCARCNGTHKGLKFTPFTVNPIDSWTHWGTCPATREPIIMQFIETAEIIPAPKKKKP